MAYDVDADLYEGPLPLLVELAKLDLIDIFLITLADLTQQYRERVKTSGMDLNELAEPLPLFGMLMALKARGLLPKAPELEEEEVPVSLEELERRLKEYEQFKSVAQLLAELHALQHQRFTRHPGRPPTADEPHEGRTSVEVGLVDLMEAFATVVEKATATVYEVTAEPWTVEMKVRDLQVLLTLKRQIRFFELFTPEQGRLELVVTFLALLELIRQRVARAVQERAFAEILIEHCAPAPGVVGVT